MGKKAIAGKKGPGRNYPQFIPFYPKGYPRQKAKPGLGLWQFSTFSTGKLLLLYNIYYYYSRKGPADVLPAV